MIEHPQFPYGLTVDNGRFRLKTRLRGSLHDGLWLASRVSSEDRDVLVTMRHIRHSRELDALLRYSAPGIPEPLYVGQPDMFSEGGEAVQREHLCVVDVQPEGVDLPTSGTLSISETISLGISLCEAISGWAATHDGVITRGLRPETIFVTGQNGERRFTGATPRPFFLLGNDESPAPYPRLSFDPPAASTFEFPVSDALFTVAAILWYANTGSHPYAIPGTDMDRNIWDDRRIPFPGPPALGVVLESALVADVARRIAIDEFEAQLRSIQEPR